jgi:rod shape-determining protein MreC
MPSNVDLQKGDRLLTSGIDGTYPAGLLVAEIKQLKISSNSPFAIVHASPLAGVHNFRHVLLVEVPKASAAQLESSQIKQQLQSNTHQKQPLTSPEQSAEAPL